MNNKQIIIFAASVIIASTLSVMTYHYCFSTKTAYIDVKKVFNGFALKKELEDKYTQTVKQRAKIMDSLTVSLQNLSLKLQQDESNKALFQEFELRREQYFKTKNSFDEDNVALSNKYDGQILEQMTQYVSDYGKKNGYKYIFGAEGNGTLMYAGDTENISDDMIAFINDKYKGVE